MSGISQSHTFWYSLKCKLREDKDLYVFVHCSYNNGWCTQELNEWISEWMNVQKFRACFISVPGLLSSLFSSWCPFLVLGNLPLVSRNLFSFGLRANMLFLCFLTHILPASPKARKTCRLCFLSSQTYPSMEAKNRCDLTTRFNGSKRKEEIQKTRLKVSNSILFREL